MTEVLDKVVETFVPASATGGSKLKSPVRVKVILPKLNSPSSIAIRSIC